MERVWESRITGATGCLTDDTLLVCSVEAVLVPCLEVDGLGRGRGALTRGVAIVDGRIGLLGSSGADGELDGGLHIERAGGVTGGGWKVAVGRWTKRLLDGKKKKSE